MWIELTLANTGNLVSINFDCVIGFCQERSAMTPEVNTRIDTTDGEEYFVRETYDEIKATLDSDICTEHSAN